VRDIAILKHERDDLLAVVKWLIDNGYALGLSAVPVDGGHVYAYDMDRGGMVDIPRGIKSTLEWAVT
jgi:hypothetical protein